MKYYIDRAKLYFQNHIKEFKIGAIAVGGVALVVLFVALYAYNNQSGQVEVKYKPVAGCSMLTKAIAKKILGDDILESKANSASTTTVNNNTTSSQCAYTDMSESNMAALAIAVRTGINDDGVAKNKEDFATNKEANDVSTISGIGEQAYYNKTDGKLHVLDGLVWVIIRYTVNAETQDNSFDKAVETAKLIFTDDAV